MIELTMASRGELLIGYTGQDEDSMETQPRGRVDSEGAEETTQEGEDSQGASETTTSAPFLLDVGRAARNVAWVHNTLQLLVDHPRLLENSDYLLGTLKSLIKSLDADNNPVMAILKLEGKQRL